jgi:hypothetical protein
MTEDPRTLLAILAIVFCGGAMTGFLLAHVVDAYREDDK